MIRATIEEIPNSTTPDKAAKWRAWCEWQGRQYEATSRNGASNALCRVLVAAGAPDGPLEVYGTNGKLRFTVASIHAAAKFTYAESSTQRLTLVRYKALNPVDVMGKVGVGPAPGYPAIPQPDYARTVEGVNVHAEAAE